ncbi:MAG: hypothetical protein ACPIOQ_05095 [Promethearchaeia archaeon]
MATDGGKRETMKMQGENDFRQKTGGQGMMTSGRGVDAQAGRRPLRWGTAPKSLMQSRLIVVVLLAVVGIAAASAAVASAVGASPAQAVDSQPRAVGDGPMMHLFKTVIAP